MPFGKKTGSYQNKVAIVTGGGSGIGRGLCQWMGNAGSIVIVTDINIDSAEATAQAIRESGGRAVARLMNVTDSAAIEETVQFAVSEYGSIDFMFNNAGIVISGEVRDLTEAHFRRSIEINLFGVINGSMSAYREMVKQGSGTIVNIASMAGLAPAIYRTAYSTSKYGVVGFSRTMRMEAAGLGVKVVAVCPGFVDTPIVENTIKINFDQQNLDKLEARKQRQLERRASRNKQPKAARRTVSLEKSINIIMRGVEGNKGTVVFPKYGYVLKYLYDRWPRFSEWISRRIVHRMRSKWRNPD